MNHKEIIKRNQQNGKQVKLNSKLYNFKTDTNHIDRVLERKMAYNKKYIKLMEELMNNTMENFYRIVNNLDKT